MLVCAGTEIVPGASKAPLGLCRGRLLAAFPLVQVSRATIKCTILDHMKKNDRIYFRPSSPCYTELQLFTTV